MTPAEALAPLPRLAPVGRLVVAVPDVTRPVDVPAALRALDAWLPPSRERLALIGLGLHRRSTPAELARLRAAWSGEVHDHDPAQAVHAGTVHGLPLVVHPAVLTADLLVTVGIVELHQYAGCSGGHKGVVVGLGGRPTLDGLHHRDMVLRDGVEVGRLDGNPFRDAVDAMGEALGVDLALQVADGRWFAGPVVETHRRAAASLHPWHPVDGAWDRVLLRVPPTKAVSLYQASRAATYLGLSPRPPLRDGATLVLDAACPDGAGSGPGELAFARVLASVPPPWGELLTGPAPQGAGTQRAVMLAKLARRYRLVVAGCAHPEALQALGVEATRRPAGQVAGPEALVIPEPFRQLPQRAR